MCGRYVFDPSDDFAERFGVRNSIGLLRNFNVTPGSVMPIIVGRDEREVELMKWGLIPSWADEQKIKQGLINARAETIAEKPAFRNAFAWRRCIVPANGFYEWREYEGKKLPYYITNINKEMMGLAGIFEIRRKKDGGEEKSYAIITKEADGGVRQIHDRMPVIIGRDKEKMWLSEDNITESLEDILKYSGSEGWDSYRVEERVNRIEENDEKLIERC